MNWVPCVKMKCLLQYLARNVLHPHKCQSCVQIVSVLVVGWVSLCPCLSGPAHCYLSDHCSTPALVPPPALGLIGCA